MEAHSVLGSLFQGLTLEETDTETLSLFPIAISGPKAGGFQQRDAHSNPPIALSGLDAGGIQQREAHSVSHLLVQS
jgi:hypothetical protein